MNYTGNDIYVSFDVIQDTKPAKVNSGGVIVNGPHDRFILSDNCHVRKNEVSYRLDKKHVKISGLYRLTFNVRIDRIGEQTHEIKVRVKKGGDNAG